MKAIILARESDKNQDSNDAQLSRILDYVKGKGLEEWKIFKLKESSTKGYRTKFQEIIEVRQLILLGGVALYHHLIQEATIETSLLVLEKTGKNPIRLEEEPQIEVNLREEIVNLVVDKYRN